MEARRAAWDRTVAWVVGVGLLALVVPLGGASATTPTSTAAPLGNLTANVTYVDLGGSWNCGQGHQSFEFFGNIQGGLAPYSYNWTFGDGSSGSAVAQPTHNFSRLGEFVVNVSVRDSAGTWLNASVVPAWGISDVCTGSTLASPLGVYGAALYVALLLAIVLGATLVVRVRRRRAPPRRRVLWLRL